MWWLFFVCCRIFFILTQNYTGFSSEAIGVNIVAGILMPFDMNHILYASIIQPNVIHQILIVFKAIKISSNFIVGHVSPRTNAIN